MNQLGCNLLARFVYPILLFVLCWNPSLAQPQFYASNQIGGSTSVPLNHGYSKSQWIYGPNNFHKGGISSNDQASYGKVSHLYFKLGDLVDTLNAYTDFTIKMGQLIGTDTTWSGTTYDSSLQTVFYQSTYSIKASKRTWISFKLPNTFVYDPQKSLAVELSVTSGQGAQLQPLNTNASTALIGETNQKTGYRVDQNVVNIGFDFIERQSNNMGIAELLSPSLFCAGNHDIYVNLINNGKNPVDSVKLNWSLDGGTTKSFWYTNRVDTFGSTNGNRHSVKLGADTFTKSAVRNLLVWTTLPNNMVDSANDDDTLRSSLKPGLNGTYTIGGSTRDYQKISEATSDLQLYGVCGPVIFVIDSGRYLERLVLNNIRGTSTTNTIVFDGIDREKCIIENKASGVRDQQTVLLNASSFVKLKNITIRVKDKQYGVGIQLIKSNNTIIERCHIELPQRTNNNKIIGIAGTGTITNVSSNGLAGNTNVFSHNKISGGSISAVYTGFDTSLFANHVEFSNNTFEGFDIHGVIINSVINAVLTHNTITGYDTTTSGITADYTNHLRVNANRIQGVNQGLNLYNINRHNYTYSGRSVVMNNMITATGFFTYGIFCNNINQINFYHNSVQTKGAYTVVFSNVDSINVLNNVFINLSAKNVFYANDSGGFNNTNTLNRNNYYVPFATSGGFAVESGKDQFRTVKSWFKADTTFNRSSFSQVPGFLSQSDLHIDSSGNISGIDVGITRDFDNDLRCNISPTLGADQFIPGISGDTLNPDKICNTGCLKYDLPTPPLFTRSSYGTAWSIDSVSVKTNSGYSSTNFSLTYPTSASDAFIHFCPDSTEVDSAFTLFLIFRDLNGRHCFSTFTSYILVGNRPNALFSLDKKELCLGDSIKVTSQNHTVDDSVIYVLGDGQKEIEASFSYLYDNAGFYTITKYFKSFGCVDSSSKDLSIGTTKRANIVQGQPFKGFIRKGKLNDPDRLCTEDTTYYQIFPPKALGRYDYDSLWRVKWVSLTTFNGTVINDTLTVQPDSFNNFRIRVFPRDAYQNDTLVLRARLISLINTVCDTTLTRYIVLSKSPHIGFTATPYCLGETITFTDTTANNAQVIDRSWYFGDGYQSNLEQDTHTYSKSGTYTLSLSVLSSNRCHGFYEGNIQIHPRSVVDFTTNDSCRNQTIAFNDTSKVYGLNNRYSWNFGDGDSANGRKANHKFDAKGVFSTTLVITNEEGCRDSVSKRINVLQKPVADFTTLTKCMNGPVQFISRSSDTVNSSYKWTFTSTDSSTVENPKHQFDQQVTANVRLIVTNNGSCPDTIQKIIELDTVPNLTFTSNTISTYQVRFTPSDSLNLRFIWHFGDGDSSTDKTPIHNYPVQQKKKYEVRCIVQDEQGCSANITDSVTVGTNNQLSLNTSTLKVFPNPFNRYLSIDNEGFTSVITSIQLIDLLGKRGSIRTNIEGNRITVYPINSLKPGLYILKIQTGETSYNVMVMYSDDI